MASVIGAAKRLIRVVARIRYRLLLINVIVAAVPLIGISFAEMHEAQLLGALETDMIHQAELVRATVRADGSVVTLEQRERMLIAAARDTRTRIRLLEPTPAITRTPRQQRPLDFHARVHMSLLAQLMGHADPTTIAAFPRRLAAVDRRARRGQAVVRRRHNVDVVLAAGSRLTACQHLGR